MIRLMAIIALFGIAALLLHYRSNEKIQKMFVLGVIAIFVLGTVILMLSELFR